MKATQTIISLQEMRMFYKEECIDENKKFSEKEFEQFVNFCEIDFHQWLRDNIKYLNREHETSKQ